MKPHSTFKEVGDYSAEKIDSVIFSHPTVSRNSAALLGSTTLLAACGGGETSSSTSAPAPSPTPTPTSSGTITNTIFTERAAAARFLLRAQFSAPEGDIDAVRKEGPDAWLARQMRQPNDQTASEYLTKNGYDEVNNRLLHVFNRVVDEMIWSQALFGGNELRKRVAFAISQLLVVSGNRLDVLWPNHAVAWFWDLLNQHAFGNFRDLLEAVALSPATGAFLDSMGNRADDPATGRRPDENFAREVMQLFTIGLDELHIDGSVKTINGTPVETYTNEDVTGLARVFTGFDLDASGLPTYPNPTGAVRRVVHPDIVRRPMTSDPQKWERPQSQSTHSLLEKRFLGITIPAGTDATTSIRIALDRLFNHPNVGPFFGKQMIQKLVTSNPSPGYIARVAQTFNNNGRGTRGDLAAVFKAIFLDPEASDQRGLNDLRFGRLREPATRFIQFARTFEIARGDGKIIDRDLSDPGPYLGQVPMRAPSVFNFFRPQYAMPNSVATANNMVSPEFQLINEISVAGYLNILPGFVSGAAQWLNGMKATYRTELPLASNSQALLDHLDLVLTAGQLRQATREIILTALNDVGVTASDDEGTLKRIHIAIVLIMASHDYLVQK